MFQIVGAALMMLLGALLLWWARASKRGTFRQQWILGYRSPLTLRDRQAWITVHRATVPYLRTAGVGALVASAGAIALSFAEAGELASMLLGGSAVWVLLWVVASFLPAAAIARSMSSAEAAHGAESAGGSRGAQDAPAENGDG